MKKIFTLFAMLLAVATFGQRTKYKDLFPTLASMSDAEQLFSLRDFLGYELDHPNANLRVALLHEKFYTQADPLTQYESVMAHAAEASKRYIKSKQLVTEQQVRSDNEYYAPIFGLLDAKGKLNAPFLVVQTKIQNGYDSANLIQQKLPAIYRTFTKSVSQYDKAVKLFSIINTTYKSEEDILMFYNDEFNGQLDELSMYYDSALAYFQQYQALTVEYPLKKYRQGQMVKEIKTYRLDGLITKMTFLESNVIFWDYKRWADQIKQTYRKEILPMKLQLFNNQRSLDAVLAKASGDPTTRPVKIDKELIYKLNNYDKNSLALSLLRYKAFKQEWLLKTNAISTDTLVNQQLELYSTLIQQNRMADSLRVLVQGSISPESVVKHKDFLDVFYKGDKGIQKFVGAEQEEIDKSLKQYQGVLRDNLWKVQEDMQVVENKFLKFGASNVPLFAVDTISTSLANNLFVTTKRLVGADGSLYLLGVSKPDKKVNNLVPYVARVNPDGKAGWIQNYPISIDSAMIDANSIIKAAVLTQEGCAFLIASTHLSRSDRANTLVYVTEKKEEKFRKVLKENSTVRELLYVEESNAFVLSFKGNSEEQNFSDLEKVVVMGVNALGDLIWRRDIELAGTLQNLLHVRDGFVLAGNFTLIKDTNGKDYRTRLATGQSNPYLIKLSERGDLVRVLPLLSEKSVYLNTVVKVNDGSINLLAFEATFDQAKNRAISEKPDKLAMVNYQLKLICSTL
jgi:hypothetical protein